MLNRFPQGNEPFSAVWLPGYFYFKTKSIPEIMEEENWGFLFFSQHAQHGQHRP
jgi:hypothetical protein